MLYLSAIFLSFFLAFVLITRNNKTSADYILIAWMAVTGFHLLAFYLYFTGQNAIYPTIVALGFPLPLVQGPFLYLYTRQQTTSAKFDKKQLLHFLPVVMSFLMFTEFYLLPLEQKVEVFRLKGQGYETIMMINTFAIYVSGIVYIILSLTRLLKFRKNLVNQFSNTEKINFNWLLYLILWMTGIWVVVLVVQEDNFIFGAAALFVLWLGYFGIKQVQVFSQKTPTPLFENSHTLDDRQGDSDFSQIEVFPENAENDDSGNSKYQKSALTDEEASLIHGRLRELMNEQKPFTNPDLTLNELAKNLEVHPNYLSQVINSKENKTFYDLINERRVQEFINLVSKPVSQQYTLLAIAFDCGFNSKASFNRNFKKYTGLTPSDFLKQKVAA